MEEREVTFHDYMGVVIRRKWILVVVFIVVMGGVIFYNHKVPPVYEAVAVISVGEQRTMLPGMEYMLRTTGGMYLMNTIEEIKSYTLMKEVARTLPEWVVTYLGDENGGQISIEQLASRLSDNVKVEQVRDADIIRVKVYAGEPNVASEVANTIVEVLQRRRAEAIRKEISEQRRYIEEQLPKIEEKLMAAELALKEFKEENKVVELDEQSEGMLHGLMDAEVLYNQAKANREEIEQRLGYIRSKIEEQRAELVPTVTEITNPLVERLKQQLVELEAQYAELEVQNYPEDEPRVRMLREQIEQTKRKLKQEMMKIVEGAEIIDPLTQMRKFVDESIELEVNLHACKAKENVLQKIMEGYKEELGKLPEKELRLAQLMREREINERLYIMLTEKREEARIAEAGRVSNIRVIDPARPPGEPISPRKRTNLLMGVVLGLVLGLGCAFIVEYMDKSVKTPQEVEAIGIPVLGCVPVIKPKGRLRTKVDGIRERMVTKFSRRAHVVEAYRSIRAGIQFTSPDRPIRCVVVTSTMLGEGKTLTGINLGIVMAELGMRTVLIDADMRRPMLHKVFDKSKKPGLTDAIMGQAALSTVIRDTGVDNLQVITTGRIPPDPAKLLSTMRMRGLIKKLSEMVDFVVIDTPPMLVGTDAMVLGHEADGVILVVQLGKTIGEVLERAKQMIENMGVKLIGAIINNIKGSHMYGYYKYYHYYKYKYYSGMEDTV